VAQLAAANERNRLAREIHDTLGHYLTVIHVQLEAARAVIGADPERGLLAVSRAQALAKDGLTAVRQSVRALREDATVEGIVDQIASLVESVRDERFSAAFRSSGTPRPVSAAVALALHRTTLEALTNVRKHADATVVRVSAEVGDGHLQLSVVDNGRGYRPAETSGDGVGVQGMKERARLLGGELRIVSEPSAGTALHLTVPLT
jgi:signal transduction histidine kinase